MVRIRFTYLYLCAVQMYVFPLQNACQNKKIHKTKLNQTHKSLYLIWHEEGVNAGELVYVTFIGISSFIMFDDSLNVKHV